MIQNEIFRNFGYCHCCRQENWFVAKEKWLRDHYICENCQSIPRQRHLHSVLDNFFPAWESKMIHESSPSSLTLSKIATYYSCSFFIPEQSLGSTVNGTRCENIEQLTFPNETFDIFITQDVLEHVFHPDRAIQEINRILKPGGFHIFTAPKHKNLLNSRQRAALKYDGTIDHKLPPEYHGNPIGDGKALVTWDYGYDFEQLISEWAQTTVQVFHTRDRSVGIDAEFNEVFVVIKSKNGFKRTV